MMNYKRNSVAKDAAGTDIDSQNNDSTKKRKGDGEPTALAGTVFKVPVTKDNTSTFKRVPRAFHSRHEEKVKSQNPPVGCYRPKHEFLAPRVKGAIPYNSYTNIGAE